MPDRHAILAGRVESGASAYRTATDTKGGIGLTDLLTKWRALPLMWSEALRALVCLVPMMVATVLSQTTYLVTLGQGAFFFSSIFLPGDSACASCWAPSSSSSAWGSSSI